jgi:hypothetical protein
MIADTVEGLERAADAYEACARALPARGPGDHQQTYCEIQADRCRRDAEQLRHQTPPWPVTT